MARPTNDSFEEALEEAQHEVWGELVDREHALLPIVRSTLIERQERLRAAAKLVVVQALQEALNATPCDLELSVEDVKAVLK